MMKLAYGTYGMPNTPWEDALRVIADTGYSGVELAVPPRYPTAPERLSTDMRRRLREVLAELDLELVAFLHLLNVADGDAATHRRRLDDLRRAYELGQELAKGPPPIVTTTLGGRSSDWESERERLVERLLDYGAAAHAMEGRLAVEPHVGGLVDRPARAMWLMKAVDHPAIRLNFDVSHFHLQGLNLAETVPVLLPYAIHAHIKDSRHTGSGFQFLLPGEGDFDLVSYFRAMQTAGWQSFVTVEVSGMVSGHPGYDPVLAARFCFQALKHALDAVQGCSAPRCLDRRSQGPLSHTRG